MDPTPKCSSCSKSPAVYKYRNTSTGKIDAHRCKLHRALSTNGYEELLVDAIEIVPD